MGSVSWPRICLLVGPAEGRSPGVSWLPLVLCGGNCELEGCGVTFPNLLSSFSRTAFSFLFFAAKIVKL